MLRPVRVIPHLVRLTLARQWVQLSFWVGGIGLGSQSGFELVWDWLERG